MSGSYVLYLKHDLSLQVFLPIVERVHTAGRNAYLQSRTLNHCSLALQLMIFEAHFAAVTLQHTLNVLIYTELLVVLVFLVF